MRSKMERYEKLLALNPDPAAQVVTARVIGETSGPFVKTRLVNAGSDDGVRPGQAVLTETWLIGRIVTAGRSSSRVLLLKDLNSRVPIMAERNGARAILAGDNTDQPKIEFLKAGHGLVNGDRIVTSGDAGQLPRGLVVGEAVVDRGGTWRVRLYGDDSPVDYVRVVRFAFPPAPEDEIAPPDAPAGEDGEGDAGRSASAGGAG
jgi:rod shape-determining protein MreC